MLSIYLYWSPATELFVQTNNKTARGIREKKIIIKKVTCLLDGRHTLGDSTGLAGADLVLGKYSEVVRVAHDEIWDCGS